MNVCVVGGGIVGLSCAYHLVKRGAGVTVIDRALGQKGKCSWGNAGLIVPSHFVPLAAPGMVQTGIRMLTKRESPLGFRMSALRWMLQFAGHCTAQNVDRHSPVMAQIGKLGAVAHQDLAEELGAPLGTAGTLMACQTQEFLEHEQHLADQANGFGLTCSVLDRVACQELTGVSDLAVAGGVHYRCDRWLTPGSLLDSLTTWLKNNGVNLVSDDVNAIQASNGRVWSVTGKEEHSSDQFVFAGGTWTGELTQQLGIRLPIVPGRGQSFDAADQGVKVPMVLMEARVAVTPMLNGTRFAGTMEIGNWSDRPNMARVRGMVESAGKAMPQSKNDLIQASKNPQDIWVGHRPCTPDGLPIIGRIDGYQNLHVAAGHAMVGLSLGPVTGQLVAQSIYGEQTAVPLVAFAPQRFA